MPELYEQVAHLTDEQLELRLAVQRFLTRHSDEASVRCQADSEERFDRSLWRRMAQELGIVGMSVPEDRGGFGAGVLELVVAAEELGFALAPQPFLASAVLGASVLAAVASSEADEVLASVISGDTLVAVVPPRNAIGTVARANQVTTALEAPGVRINGRAEFVVNGAQAGQLLVFTDVAGTAAVVLVETGTGVTLDDRPTLDLTRAQATVVFEGALGTVLATGAEADSAWQTAQTRTILAIAAEEVGVARRCLGLSVEYGRVREQFGRLIGSYQVIKHKCTDMLMALDLAQCSLNEAARAVDEMRVDASALVHMSRYLSQNAAALATRECIQVHGGIGFTWEHPAHLYFKRASANAAILGSALQHLDAYAELSLNLKGTQP